MLDFWGKLDSLLASSEIVLDHPKGSYHQDWPGLYFPLDYGYLTNTTGGDGDGIDVWLGTEETRTINAVACTVDTTKRDAEIKLLIGCNDEEIAIIEDFHNGEHQSAIIIRRDVE
jgi:inorganic pyrophosphatase